MFKIPMMRRYGYYKELYILHFIICKIKLMTRNWLKLKELGVDRKLIKGLSTVFKKKLKNLDTLKAALFKPSVCQAYNSKDHLKSQQNNPLDFFIACVFCFKSRCAELKQRLNIQRAIY